MSQFDRDLAMHAKRFGLGSITATLLEGLAPLGVLGAQALYLLEPLFGSASGDGWKRLAHALEDPDQLQGLTAKLRDGVRHGEH